MNTIRSKRSMAIPLAVTLAATTFLGACGNDSKSSSSTTTAAATTTKAPATGSVTVTGAWARTSPKMTSAGAVYMVIDNGTGEDDALLKASVDPSVAKMAQLHETKADGGNGMSQGTAAGDHMSSTTMGDGGGMMTMKEVERIPVPAGGSVKLEPGGYHVMLMDLAAPLKIGEKVKVTLTFEKAGEIVVEADVRASAP